jgi:hypothetical protein
MAATNVQQGTSYAIVFGAPSADVKFGSSSTAAGLIINGYDFTPTAEEVLTTDAEGKVVNITTFNFGAEATLTVKFKSTTKALALAEFVSQTPGTKVLVVDASTVDSYTDHDLSAVTTGKQYGLKSFTKTGAPGQPATATVVIRRFDSITDYAALT